MNSLWGKFAQKMIETDYEIKLVDDIEEYDRAQFWELISC